MNNLVKLPVTVITGFLGSGKTTLIRHLLTTAQNKRLAVVVNEFGDVGIDGEILKSCAIPECPAENIVELANGCICCTVADDFIPTIETLISLDPSPEHILIETSGLALPKPLLKAFDWPDIKSRITVDGVIALADADAVSDGRFAPNVKAVKNQREADESLDHETPLSEVFEDQICCADLILLTKPDLVTDEAKNEAKRIISDIAPKQLPVIEIVNGSVDPQIILGLESESENDLDSRPSHHDTDEEHDHEDFDSITVDVGSIVDPDQLVNNLKRLATEQNILRVKGYANIENKPMRLLIQAVGSRIRTQYDRRWAPDEEKKTRLVIIAEQGNLNHQAVSTLLNSK